MDYRINDGVLSLTLDGRIDSTNAQALQDDLDAILDETQPQSVTIDAEDLDYISSAGLRLLLKIARRVGGNVCVEGVSTDVYEIFDVTGFTQLMDVRKALRRIHVDGCPTVGQGATATVYRIDRETVVKVFKAGTALPVIQREIDRSKKAFLAGIPTAISYDLVKVGECYGTVYELLEATDFLTVLREDRDHLDDHIAAYARAIRDLHQIELDAGDFPPSKRATLTNLQLLADSCTTEELDKIRMVIETIPDRSTFIHGDSHPGNVMLQNGEFVFIDFMACGSGHPVFDLTSMCIGYSRRMSAFRRKNSILLEGHSEEEAEHMWEVFLRTYLDTDDEDLLSTAEDQIASVICARMLLGSRLIPGLLDDERFERMKQFLVHMVDQGLKTYSF